MSNKTSHRRAHHDVRLAKENAIDVDYSEQVESERRIRDLARQNQFGANKPKWTKERERSYR
jgi:hypothetical protein